MKEVRKTENNKVHDKEEKNCAGDTRSETNKTQIGVPGYLSWKQCPVTEGKISFECPKCKETHRLQNILFSSQSAKPTEGLMPTSEYIICNNQSVGILFLTFVVVITIGVILALIVGEVHFWITIVCVVIWKILRPIFITMFSKKLPVWAFECKNCGNRIFIASDGTAVAIGEIQAKVGE
jgi:predicted RNA-binding Zn-ribbon protein involved in translation (DUF1610 family)